MTSTDGTRARSTSTSPRSISRATTRPARRASSPVRAPAPGPISRTRSWVVGARRSTIAQATPASRRKCWPSARRLVARTLPRLEVGEERLVDPAHPGDRRLEALALLGNGKDDDAELRPVERPVALEDPPPELGDDVVVGGLAGRDHLAREHVGVDDHAPETTEDLGNGGFAGRDAPGQSHE